MSQNCPPTWVISVCNMKYTVNSLVSIATLDYHFSSLKGFNPDLFIGYNSKNNEA